MEGDNNRVEIGENCKLSNMTINIIGDSNNIEIGSKCSISNWNLLLSVPAVNRNVKIGARTYIGSGLFVLPANNNSLEIGEDCMFSNEIIIRVEDGHPIYDLDTKELCNKGGMVKIGRHCWIGERAYILKGVSLADDTIVGACSLVAKSSDEKNVVLGGTPAKVIKRNVGWKMQYIDNYKP